MKPRLCMVFAMLLHLGLVAQIPQDAIDYSFKHIKKGMSLNYATSFLEDSKGFMWIGTPSGLNRYDGENFYIYKKESNTSGGLHNNYITNLYETKDSLYILTINGLNVYKRNQNKIVPYPFKKEGLEIQDKSLWVLKYIKDYMYLGTYESGLYQYNINTGSVHRFYIDPSKNATYNTGPIRAIEALDNSNLVVISNNTVFVINSQLQILDSFSTSESILSSHKEGSNRFIIGTSTGKIIDIEIVNDKIRFKQKELCKGYAINSLAKDHLGNLWAGTFNDGIHIFSLANNNKIHLTHNPYNPESIPGNSIWSIMATKDGVVWTSAYKSGISYYNPQQLLFQHYETIPNIQESLSNNIVNCFIEDKEGNYWVGTDGGGLDYWNRKENMFEHYALANGTFGSNVVLSLVMPDDNTLWTGTWGKGIQVFDLITKKYTALNQENSFLQSNHVFDLHIDEKKQIWIANFYGSLFRYNPVNKTHKEFDLRVESDKSKIITLANITQDKQGNIWVGTRSKGLFKVTEKDGNWEALHYSNKLSKRFIRNNVVNQLLCDSKNNIWAATNEGINKYNEKTDDFEVFELPGIDKNRIVKALIEDNHGNLWISLSNSLVKYNLTTEETLHFDESDGVQSEAFNEDAAYKTSKGELFFGGSGGFNLFNPIEIQKNTERIPLYLSNLKIFNQAVKPNDKFGVLTKDISQTDSLQLSYKHNVIDFEFNAITFKNAAKVKYAYYLEGFETKWNYVADKNTATYTNLNPGTYTLHIKSSNADGIWVDNAISVFIKITPPFWETWWFRISITLVLIGLAYAFYLQRTRRIKAYQRRLKKEIKARTFELEQQQHKLIETANQLSERNEEIKRFTYALSHDLKSPLGNITLLTRFIADDLGDKKSKDTEKYLEFIDEACATLQTLIADITEIAKLGHIKNKNEAVDTRQIAQKAIAMMVSRVQEQDVKILIAENMPVLVGDANRFFQVFENLLDNAVKYMGDQKNPSITIESHTTVDEIKITIRDNGSGMDKNALNKLFTPFERFNSSTKGTGLGLFMTKKVVESHEGTLTASSAGKGKGATFKLSFPLSRLHCA